MSTTWKDVYAAAKGTGSRHAAIFSHGMMIAEDLPPQNQSTKGRIYNDALGIDISFQYNPEKLDFEKPVLWHDETIGGMHEPLTTFERGDKKILSLRILLDAFHTKHPRGHVLADINDYYCLTYPYDHAGLPTLPLPQPTRGVRNPGTVGKPGGIPPLVKIAYAGRVFAAVVENVAHEEVMNGIIDPAKDQNLPIRAWVDLEFRVIEDYRMYVDFESHFPGLGEGGASLPSPADFDNPQAPWLEKLQVGR